MNTKNNRIKVAVLIDLLVPGGIQKAAIEEVKNLKSLGFKAELFCLVRKKYDYQYKDLTRNLKITYLSDFNPFPFKTTRKLPFFSFLTTNHLLNPLFVKRYQVLKQFNLIISHGTTTCFTARAVTKVFGIPYFAYIWDPMEFILNKIYKNSLGFLYPAAKELVVKLETIIVRGAFLILTPSRVHQNYLKKSYRKRIEVIYPGYDFFGRVREHRPRYILGYTRWQKEKNPDFFLKLAQKVNYPILLAGLWTDPSELKLFKEKVRRQKLNITIKDVVKHQDIPKLAEGAIAWVHPNFEAFGMVSLEMARFGVPIIIPKGSGVTEIFQDGVHGCFPNNNEKSLILAVKNLINNPRLRNKMGKNAQNTALRYTWKIHAERIARLIKNHQKYS